MSLKIIEIIAERKILEAMERGDFDNLPGMGKPLPRDGLENVPEELRMAFKILMNAGMIPEEVELRKSMTRLKDLINACTSERERKKLKLQLNQKQLRYNMLVEKKFNGTVEPRYHDRIMKKLE